MQKIILLCFFTVSGLLSFSQDQAVTPDKNAVTRDAKDFHAVQVSGGIDLYLSTGSEETVAVSAADISVRDHMHADVEDGVLKIYLENEDGRVNGGHSRMKAYVSYKQLNAIEASGGSNVFMHGVLKGDKLAINLSGGGNLKGALNVSGLNVRQSGGSNVDVTGAVGELSVETSGGGDFKGYDLVADIGHIDASGGGNVHVTVNKELFVVASGGSDIYYRGAGVVRSVSSSGGSEIRKNG